LPVDGDPDILRRGRALPSMAGTTKALPTTTDDGRPFIHAPWDAPLDADGVISSIPASARIAGMFFIALVTGAQARGCTLPSARERYVPFNFYPVAELARLLLEAAERFYPQQSLRLALRALGASAPRAFVTSTLGKMTLGSAEGVHSAVAAMAGTYKINIRPSHAAIRTSGPNWVIVGMKTIQYFLDSHHVGVFEGTIRYAGGRDERVQIASQGSSSAEFLLTWNS
jgi:uncharacterized protein (TIGR02265 family)